MRKKIIAGNWKMNMLLHEGLVLINNIVNTADVQPHQEVIFAPPFPFLSEANRIINNKQGFQIAAQNCHYAENGSFTGEVSASILKSFACNYVILGHSERRQHFNETNDDLKKKTTEALRVGLKIIFCCGESLGIREAGKEVNFVKHQLKESLQALPLEGWKNIVIAYEPIWAIGTGKTAKPEQVQYMHQSIRNWIKEEVNESLAKQISIVYGGSVNAQNAADLLILPDVDGGLIGGASLQKESFSAIIRALPL